MFSLPSSSSSSSVVKLPIDVYPPFPHRKVRSVACIWVFTILCLTILSNTLPETRLKGFAWFFQMTKYGHLSKWVILTRKTQKRFRVEQLSKNQYPCLFTTWRMTRYISYCRFARDVTAAMLLVKNKSISLLWEINSIFMYMFRKKLLYGPLTWPPCHVVPKQEYPWSLTTSYTALFFALGWMFRTKCL